MNNEYIETLLDTRKWIDKKGNYARAKKSIMRKKLRTYNKKDTSLESILYDEIIRLMNLNHIDRDDKTGEIFENKWRNLENY